LDVLQLGDVLATLDLPRLDHADVPNIRLALADIGLERGPLLG
jgi:hypothetical protein